MTPDSAVAHERFPLFDGLRAIAALSVLLFHASLVTWAFYRASWGPFTEALQCGVLVFFAISGFLLYRPFVVERRRGGHVALRSYARRRALRILPAYWVALTVLAIWPGIPGVFGDDWWRYYGFAQTYDDLTISKGLPVAWSLCVEVTFYAALPLFALAAARISRRSRDGWLWAELGLLGAITLVGLAVRVGVTTGELPDTFAVSLVGTLEFFAVGMALAVVSVACAEAGRSPRAVAAHPGVWWLLAGAIFVALGVIAKSYPTDPVAVLLKDPDSVPTSEVVRQLLTKAVLPTLMAGLLLLPAVFMGNTAGVPRRVLGSRPAIWVGKVSYGVYLWHMPVLVVLATPGTVLLTLEHTKGLGLDTWLPGNQTLSLVVIGTAVTLAIAAASYYLVEQPFLRLKERRASGAQTEPALPELAPETAS